MNRSGSRLYRIALAGGASAALATAMLMASALPAAAANVKVAMHEFQFCPETAAGALQCPGATAPAGNGGVVTINPGDSVTWVWAESTTDLTPNCDTVVFALLNLLGTGCPGHTVTKVGQPYGVSCDAPAGAGCPYTYTFNVAGTFHYYCVFHGGRTQGNKPNNPLTNMDGTVVVKGAQTSADTPTTTDSSTGQVLSATTTRSGGNGSGLPNTAVPGLPNAGHRLPSPAIVIPAVLLLLATASLGALLAFRRRRSS